MTMKYGKKPFNVLYVLGQRRHRFQHHGYGAKPVSRPGFMLSRLGTVLSLVVARQIQTRGSFTTCRAVTRIISILSFSIAFPFLCSLIFDLFDTSTLSELT